MPQIRKNPLTGETVCFSEQRANRPMNFRLSGSIKHNDRAECPFCIENSHLIESVLEFSESERFRAIANKYPAITEMDDLPGSHEVIIDSFNHDMKLADFEADDMYEIFKLIRSRYIVLAQSEYAACVLVFKNEGGNAGASIRHSHWQILSLPEVPARSEIIVKNAKKLLLGGNCVICEEYNDKAALIAENSHCYSTAGYAPRFCHEISIRIKEHICGINNLDDITLRSFSEIFLDSAKRISKITNGADINVLMYNPLAGGNEPHFFAEIFPRLGRTAGLELLSGCYINHITPEKSAAILRSAL